MNSILQATTEWPLVVSILALVLTLIGATWRISGAINKKVDKTDFDEHCKENKEDFEKEHQHATGKVSLAIFEMEREQSRLIIAAMKQDIEMANERNDEMIKMLGEMNAKIGVIDNNIDWIKKNLIR